MFKFLIFAFSFVFFMVFASQAKAIYNPLERPNNFHGIHILFTSELDEAASLVNSNNGEWGYVTIPIQGDDKDLEKWQDFMDRCREKKLIPIIRIATEPYHADTSVWRKPTELDIIDFANFLNSLEWPIENRYVIIFNEVNRFDEWEGKPPNPERYAELLSFAVDVFKRRSEDFYIIMAGLDNAAPNDRVKYMDNLVFIREMIEKNPDAIRKIDGFSSHSYPNPAFSQPPSATRQVGTATYKYEYDLINSISDKQIPAFITETGWVTDSLSASTIASYYKTAYEQVWGPDSDKIVAITPFLLNSTGGMFENFSFVLNGARTQHYEAKRNISKARGEPVKTEIKQMDAEKPGFRSEKFFESSSMTDTSSLKRFLTEYIRLFF